MAICNVSKTRIVGLTNTVPSYFRTVEDHAAEFGKEQAEAVAANSGVHKRHVASREMFTSDLCYDAADRLLKQLNWDRETVNAVLLVTQTPDFLSPATACTLQHRLGLSIDCIAFDVNQGCSGYVYGLWLASQMVSSGTCRRVLLLVGDTLSKTVQRGDQAAGMLFGDAASATALEYDETAPPLIFSLGTDGSGAKHLMNRHENWQIVREDLPEPAASSSNEYAVLRASCSSGIFMDGAEIFTFTLKTVPKIVNEVMQAQGWKTEDVDDVVMHQANLFILKNLGRRLKLPAEKMPLSINEYGNTSSGSIPMTLELRRKESLQTGSRKLVLVGFGVGLSWGAVAVELGDVQFCGINEISVP